MSQVNSNYLSTDSIIVAGNVIVGNATSNITIQANTTTLQFGNSTSNVVVNTTIIRLGNSTVNTTINTTSISTTNLSFGGNVYNTISNSSNMTNTQIFTANGTWSKPSWATAYRS